MKKLLASALAAALLLTSCVTAMADSTETISGKSYTVGAYEIEDGGDENSDPLAYDTDVNSLTVEYDYEAMDEVTTGRYSEDAKMILIYVEGFDTSKLTGDISITIDGKDFDVDDLVGAEYQHRMGYDADEGILRFPVEATKSGYSDTYVIEIESDDGDGNTVTETARITLRMVNESSYKNAETATISRISGSGVDAYIVGSRLYLDYAASSPTDDGILEITFRDEDGKLFDVVTWAYNPSSDAGNEESVFVVCDEDGDEEPDGLKLDSSVAYFKALANTYDYFDDDDDYYTDVYFTLETSSDIYETKEYDVVVRTDVYETDPKGIYFEESSITLDIGESYTPNVLGVATGRTVDAVIEPGTGTSRNVIDIEDDDTIIGTQEGTAYVTATYTFISSDGETTTYESSSMKVTVTDEVYDGETEEDTDDDATSTYMVTASTLNVRTGPSTSYSKAAYQLTSGELVEVVSIANGWAQLEDGNYVSAQYLMAVTTSDDGSATTMYVTCRTLNVRTGPSTSYSKVGTLSRGTAVEVVGTYGNWARLSNGYYVSMSYLSA